MDRFRQVEEEYYRLRGQMSANRITRQQFETALQSLMFQDSEGRYWMMGADSGQWHVYNGQAWVQADPRGASAQASAPPPAYSAPPAPAYSAPPAPTYAAPPQQIVYVTPAGAAVQPAAKQGGGCGGGCGKFLACGCLVVIVLAAAIVGGGYWASQSGMLNRDNLMKLIGQGPADIEVDNFRDDNIYVTITQLNVPQDQTPSRASLTINSFDVAAYHVEKTGKYKVDFGTTQGSANLGTCTLTVKSGDQYQFVPLPTKVIINRTNSPASATGDFLISTSSLCR
jgi:hypothetical protein